WNRALSRRSQQELVELNVELDELGMTVADAIRIEQDRMLELENLGRLRLQEEQLALKIQTVRRVMSRVETDEPIPPWVDKTVSSIGWIGAALVFFGIVMYAMGGDSQETLGGALAAAAFGFAGIMWWGVRNGLRNHFDRKVGIQLDDLTDEARQADRQLRTIQDRIGSMAVAGSDDGNRERQSSSTAELIERIGRCSRRVTDLERLARRQERAAARRRRLQTLRDRFRSAQQTVTQERNEWCRVLTQLGLEETVDVQQAFDWWQRIQELRELHTRWKNIAPEAEGLRRMFNGMKDRIIAVHDKLKGSAPPAGFRPLELLTAWQTQLKTLERDIAERQRLDDEAATSGRQAIHMQHQLEAAELRRDAVLARAGVTNREELTVLQEAEVKRRQLQSQLKKVQADLLEVSTSEPELAMTEDELIRFNPPSARETIRLRELELTDVEDQLKQDHEELGSLKQEIRLLESSRDSNTEFFQRGRLAAQIYRTAEQWFATLIEQSAVLQIRRTFEQENISGTLVTASSYMHRMTSGRYHRIWAPLGEDFLCIDDEYGQ
ncbi:MAG: hypothetical protein KDA85_11735, partial [Planctomycetaceae bacterium]|nr:hypothetical protein [Planctomycetaceae bacterium]